jgi:hypothetical protein
MINIAVCVSLMNKEGRGAKKEILTEKSVGNRQQEGYSRLILNVG